MEIINDPTKFVRRDPTCGKVGKDNTIFREGQLKTFLYSLKSKELLPDKVYKQVYPTGSVTARMYGVPKIHKLNNNELGTVIPPLRPINSSIGAFNYKLSKYLSELLKPVIPIEHCATDSFTFVDEIKQIRLNQQFLVSYDVVNLFTNIPLKQTIDLAVDMLFSHYQDIKMSKTQMRKLFVFATSNAHFLYDGIYYDQIDGVQMGSPLGPVLANLFMGVHEKTWLTSYGGPKVLHYRRYVDDIFCVFEKEEDVDPFLSHLNRQHPNIKFTILYQCHTKLD